MPESFEDSFFKQNNKPKKPEAYDEQLGAAMVHIGEQGSERTKEGLIGPDGAISMDVDHFPQYAVTKGKIDSVEKDKELIRNSHDLWSGILDQDSVDNFRKLYGFEGETEEEAKARMMARYEGTKKEATRAEMAITLLLHKGLGDKYVVVRASEYDDFHYGVDNLIISRETGEVIGAFDELVAHSSGVRMEQKKTKLLKKALNGGAKIKYGVTFDGEKVSTEAIENLPIFIMALTKDQLMEALEAMDFDNLDSLNAGEAKVLDGLLESLEEQAASLLDDERVQDEHFKHKEFKRKLEASLVSIKDWRQKIG